MKKTLTLAIFGLLAMSGNCYSMYAKENVTETEKGRLQRFYDAGVEEANRRREMCALSYYPASFNKHDAVNPKEQQISRGTPFYIRPDDEATPNEVNDD